MTRIDLTPTLALHEELLAWGRSHESVWREACADAADRLHAAGIRFEGGRDLPWALTALALSADDDRALCRVVERLHGLVERALDAVLGNPTLLERHFSAHRRMFPYLRKSAGQTTWQGASRYDVVVTPAGEVKFIELNTACPAGFFNTRIFSDVFESAVRRMSAPLPFRLDHSNALCETPFIDELLALESRAGRAPETVGLLNDENGLRHELDLMTAAFARRGRKAVVGSAADLRFDGDHAWLGEERISAAYNKLRISTEQTPNHGWKPGFETRYRDFLAALAANALPAMNNLAAMTVAEDKTLLGVLLSSDLAPLWSDDEAAFLAEHVLSADPLPATSDKSSAALDLRTRLERDPHQYVVKPANEGRGFGVAVGRFCGEAEWREACRGGLKIPMVVQPYVEPVKLPVVLPHPQELHVQPMFLTLAFGVVGGRCQGVMPRVSPEPVTNVARHGMLQGAFVVAP